MFGVILEHYINVLGKTLSMFWNALDVSFHIVPSKFPFMYENMTLYFKFLKQLKCGNIFLPLVG